MSSVSPVVDPGLGNSSWVIDLGDRRLAVVDPGRHPGPFLAEAERRGATVAFSIETHLHADFVTGSLELARFGAAVVASAGAELDWASQALTGGDTIDLGGLTLRAVATPGHTPEHLAYVLADSDLPLGVFTGGSLLVGAVARTDLIAPDATEGLSRSMWRSLQELMALPDETPVYPTHGAGSFCSAPGTDRRSTTIGEERRTNPLLAAPDEDAFVKALLASLGSYPAYFLHLRDVNRAGPEVLGVPQPPLPALDLDSFERALDSGARLVDTRPVEAWAAGHIAGALANPLRPQFASWLGWLVERDRPLVFVVGADQDRAELVRQCRQIGYDALVGELAGGMAAWNAHRRAVANSPLLDAAEVTGRVLDVRQDSEYDAGHLPAAAHIELGQLSAAAKALRGIDVVMCGHGERAATAASLLERAGHGPVAVAVGGPEDWAARTGQPLVRR